MHHPLSSVMVAAIAASLAASGLFAQSATTSSIQGSVQAIDGTDVDGTEVIVVNTATGFAARSEVRDGRFFVPGLEVGGPYFVTVQRLGFHTQERGGLFLKLGELVELRFVMASHSIPLDTLRVAVEAPLGLAHAHGGTGTTIREWVFDSTKS